MAPAATPLTVDFPPLSSYHRRIVHRMAEHYGLAHRVFDVDPQLVAFLPPHSTSKYRHVQVLVHPHQPLRAPESLLRLRDVLLPPVPILQPTASITPGIAAAAPPFPAVSSPQRLPRRSDSPVAAAAVDATGTNTTATVAAAPVRLLMRRPESAAASSNGVKQDPIQPATLGSVSVSVDVRIAAASSLSSLKEPLTNSTPESAGEVDTDAVPDIPEHNFGDSDGEDDDDGEEHMDERLRLQLRARKEEYAKARARIFGAGVSNEEETLLSTPQSMVLLPAVEGPLD